MTVDRNSLSDDESRKQLADYAMVLDMVGLLASFATVKEQVERLFEIFTLICGPKIMSFLPIDDDTPGEPISRPAEIDVNATKARLLALQHDFSLTQSGQGFIFRIDYAGKPLGILEVENVTIPDLMDHYVNLALNARSVMGIALSNARLYENEMVSRAKVQSYADQLALLHEISLSFNREADQTGMLTMVLKGAAQLTRAGVGAMLLSGKGAAQPVSLYQAPGADYSLQTGEGNEALFQFTSHAVQESERDVILISGIDDSGPGFESSRPPSRNRELLIGALRDTQGRICGHFVLSGKENGERFTSEDEQIISLLAAQSSVALTSVENFEREHRVAEALMDALLPTAPIRNDIDVGLLYRSAGRHKIGGDFYDFVDLGKDRVAVAVGDVCGKGLQAATYNAMMKYMLRAFLSDGRDPGDCLARLNRAVFEQMPEDRFVTMCLALIETRTGNIAYSSAGHPYPIMYTGLTASPLKTSATLPLGVLENFIYPTSQVSCTEAGSILMYTDGIIEARSPDDVQYGHKRLLTAFASPDSLSAQGLAESLLGQVVEFTQGELKDDAALLVLKMRKNISR